VVTAAGLTFTSLLAATVFVETTFALPGAGSLLIESLNFKDIPVVQALSMALAAGILLVNLLTDLTYAIIDPRIDLTKSLQ
jgi:peptide/nickel transport system permease protein